MEVYGYDMVDSGYREQICEEPGSDGTSVRLLLRLAGVWEIACLISSTEVENGE